MISIGKGVYARKDIAAQINAAQCIFFDCDGVLVNVAKSYDNTIRKTVDILLDRFAGIEKNPIPVTAEIIEAFKASGGFNDEIDLTYAVSLCIVAASGDSQYVMHVADAADSTGLASVEEYLANVPKVCKLRNKLAYPGDGHGGLVYDIFDSIFYGSKLYASMNRDDVGVSQKSGLIDYDKVIMDANLAPNLTTRFGRKPGIVTGRGMLSIRHTLGRMLDDFDVENSLFLEDEPRKMAKPNPESLVHCMAGMGIERSIFVGDSIEDLILSQRALESDKKVTFCGVIGTSLDPQKKLELFEDKGAHMAVDSVLRLPQVLTAGKFSKLS
ncbi:MAG: phosphatase [Cenarchaeum symbiont of Oopsacas minuta]|nr:phosphatase [Cenarchaeum symbiont of Oopsacas minuta]